MQQVLDEAGRLLKLVWRVSLPAGTSAGDSNNNQQVHQVSKLINCIYSVQSVYRATFNLFILQIRMSC